MWERSSLSSERLRLKLLMCSLFASSSLLFGACASQAYDADANTALSDQRSDPQSKRRRSKTVPPGSKAMDQSDLTNVEALLKQLQRAGDDEAQAAEALLDEGVEMAKQRRWGPSGKGYGGSVMYKPSTQALIGYADATAMIDRIREDKEETLRSKTDEFRHVVKLYRTAMQFAERANDPLTPEARAQIEERINCLEAFIQNPDPQAPGTCQYVHDALKASGIK